MNDESPFASLPGVQRCFPRHPSSLPLAPGAVGGCCPPRSFPPPPQHITPGHGQPERGVQGEQLGEQDSLCQGASNTPRCWPRSRPFLSRRSWVLG